MPNLLGKVAIITGASSGIGSATAEYFAQHGCKVTLSGRNEDNLNETKAKCLKSGLKEDQILIVKADASKKDNLQIIVDRTIEQFKKLDILINCAGIVVYGPVANASIDLYDSVMDINVRGVILLTQLCIPHLVETKGTIVNVSSIAGPCSFPNVSYYCMSKAAIDQFTKCLALELASQGIRVNAVNPGVIITDIHKRSGMNDEHYAEFLEKSKSTHALGRVGTADEVAKAIGFLASDESSFTTGELLRIDGGRGIMTPR
jgi:NAD(P)-dependent dehydrogenase (short-subunit alcohol dehydrogenase family)